MPYTYAFVGLTPSERALLESIFALDAAEGDDLERVHRPEDADLLIVNGDDRAVVQRLREANPGALLVLVGQPPGGADLPVLRRPMDMAGVVRVLGALDWPHERRSQPADFGGTFSPSALVTQPAEALPPAIDAHDRRAFAPTTASVPLDPLPRPSAPAPAPSPSPPRATLADAGPEVLVVIGPHGERSPTLAAGLRKLGYRVGVADGAAQAQRLLARQAVPFVFMDQASLGDELMPLARALAARRQAPHELPHLIVVAHHGHLFERLRARMVGCVWMRAPLQRGRLMDFLAHRGLLPQR